MIAKKIPNKKAGSTKASRCSGVANYIVEPERSNGLEKCIHHEADNFLTDTHEGHVAEMIALAQDAVRSKDPIDHWVLSWPPTERPTVEQVREAVHMFTEHCGLKGHQTIWGLHDDTKNLHVHIVVNRVHPETLKVVEINKGFQLNAAHQAIAIIEKKQGWKSVENARYQTNEKGELITDNKTKLPKVNTKDKPPEPTGPAQDMEIQTGQKSAQRVGIEHAAPIIAQATSWKELHANMAAAGMQYERKGSGAVVQVGDVLVKASDIDRKASLTALQKRFGPYQPPTEIKPNEYHNTSRNFTEANAKKPHPVAHGKDAKHGLRNLSERTLAHSEKGKQVSRPRVLQLDVSPDRRGTGGLRRDTGRAAEVNRGPERAADTSPGRSRNIENGSHGQRDRFVTRAQTESGKGGHDAQLFQQRLNDKQTGWEQYKQIKADNDRAKNAERLELQKLHGEERATLAEKLKAERSVLLAGEWRGKGEAKNLLQSFTATQQAAEKLELQERQRDERKSLQAKYKPLPMYKQWKEQPQIVSLHVLPVIDQHIIRDQQITVAQTLRSLTPRMDDRHHITYQLDQKDVFRDEGRTIQILDLNSDRGIAAALATAQQKFGQVLTLTGSLEFQRNAVAVAVKNGLTCRFSEPALDKLREQLQHQKYQNEREAERAERERPAAELLEKSRPVGEAVSPVPDLTQSNNSDPGEAVPLNPRHQTPDTGSEVQEVQELAQTAADWIAAQPKPAAEPYSNGASKATFAVLHIGRDGIVLNHGRSVAKYPLQPDLALQVGDLVVIDRSGALSVERRQDMQTEATRKRDVERG